MDAFGQLVAKIGAWVWNAPLLFVILACYLIMSIMTGFVQFKHFPSIMKNTFGKMFKAENGEGTVSPFAAAMTALAQSIGASNIVGVPLAIAIGGPGAMFWMWIACLLGMGMRYSEIVIAMKYREKNPEGEWIGGPQMYMKKGLNAKGLAMLWSIAYVLICLVSVPAQTASVVDSAATVGIPNWVTVAVMFIASVLVIWGGVKRIASFTEIVVPFMAVFYFVSAWIIIIANGNQLGHSFYLIFSSAFSPASAVGGFVGAGVFLALRQCVARGIYSFGAGMGDFTIAHCAATAEHPCQQAQWGVFEMVGSFIVCTTSGLLALSTNLWTVDSSQSSAIATLAFNQFYPGKIGGYLLALSLFLFAYSTVLVAIFYGQKQAEYIGGAKFAKIIGVIYLLCIPFGAIGNMGFFLNFVDIFLAFIVFSNIICVTAMGKQVKELVKDYYKE